MFAMFSNPDDSRRVSCNPNTVPLSIVVNMHVLSHVSCPGNEQTPPTGCVRL